MHRSTCAGARRRARRALLAGVLAILALPAGASASVLENDPNTPSGLRLRADQETNTVTVRDVGVGLEVVDLRGLTERTGLCSAFDATTVRCAKPSRLNIDLGDHVPGPARDHRRPGR